MKLVWGDGKQAEDLHDGGIGKDKSNTSLGFGLNLGKSDELP